MIEPTVVVQKVQEAQKAVDDADQALVDVRNSGAPEGT